MLRSKPQRYRQQHFEAVSYVALAFRHREVQVEVCRCRRGYRGRGRGSVGRQWRRARERERETGGGMPWQPLLCQYLSFFFLEPERGSKLSTWECWGVTFMTASKCCQHAGASPAHRLPTARVPPAMPRRVTHAKEGEKEKDPSVPPPSSRMPPPAMLW